MTNILPFPAIIRHDLPSAPEYREPTPDEYQQIIECLGRMRHDLLTLQAWANNHNQQLVLLKNEARRLLKARTPLNRYVAARCQLDVSSQPARYEKGLIPDARPTYVPATRLVIVQTVDPYQNRCGIEVRNFLQPMRKIVAAP